MMIIKLIFKGGTGSGHHGHAGRPGKRGGSAPGNGSGVADVSAYKDGFDQLARLARNSTKDFKDVKATDTSVEFKVKGKYFFRNFGEDFNDDIVSAVEGLFGDELLDSIDMTDDSDGKSTKDWITVKVFATES